VLSFLGLEAGFDEIDQDAAGAGLFGFGQGEDALGDAGWERNALANGTVRSGHGSILPQTARQWLGA
jgi:hypothetical protein